MKKRNKIVVALLSILMVSLLVITGVTLLMRHQRATAVTADVSWYDENGKEFTITTAEQLYGLAQLSESYDFKGQTIKLDADIVVNEGNAEDWVKTVPEKLWIPITGFAGKFDGQGHTISGIYGDSIITSLGLFTDTQKTCVIKDLKLVNSCFKNNNEKGTGSIIGIGGGKLENIYSDAVIVSAGKFVGGLIGRVIEKGENQITNCWFDGTITMKGANTSEVGGLVGAYTVEDAINAIQHCLSTADIECMGKQVGGIVGNLGSNSFLNLIDTMYTGTLKYDTNYYDKVGSAIGVITGGSSAIIKDTYTVDEIANRTIGTTSGYQEGSAIAISATELTGVGGYQWTTLDFENYWSAQTDEMPILTYFAEKSESVAGLDRLVDISWYNPTGLTFEIKNAKQFYGFAYLSRSYDFSGQTIKLGADITINEGNAEDWQEEAPKYKWTPIAWHGTSLSKRFKGNFDGQGHTISGIYVKGGEDDGYIGLFGEIYHGSVVKNFKIVNSYFEGTMDGSVRGTVGSVCGRLRGTIDSVYSDAIIVNSARMTGGIAGMINGTGQNTISNCWFDGKITGVSRMGGILGGVYGNKANIEGTIEHCLNTGDIAVQIGKGDVGGMCGIAETWCTLYIKDCLNAGTFSTVGEGAKANTHIGTIFGSVTQTDSVGSKVIISNSFGTKEFYDKLVGWKFGDEGIEQSSVAFVSADEVKGYGGYQWTTLDFKDSWAVRTDDVPVPVVFATSRPSVSGIARMVDYSWYDANSDVMTIKTYQQLYAMARLWDVTNLFKDKTIKLGADIVVNEGNAADWAEKAPALVWEPMKFNGTFDGQGHTISGIYVKGGAEDNYVGLFHRVYQNGTVKNLKLVNSYIEGTMAANQRGAVGSIAGRNNGIIDTVYSNAIVVNSARMTGGIVGMITGEGENVISNSWFDGKVTGVSRTGGILGGVYGNKEDIKADISHCLNTGDIAVQIGYGDVGGLCGMVETGGTLNLTDSLNAGTFATVGEGKEANTHIGTLVGSITKTDEVSSKVVMKHVYGVEEFYSKLVGWNYADSAVSKSSVAMTDMAEINGNGGYKWTTLDFDKYWATRTEDVPVLLAFTDGASSVAGIDRMIDLSWYDENSDEYVITTKEQLYGFNVLCDKEHDYFAGKTVKLGANITLNSGAATDWMKTAPANEWTPINFKGTFDGQGHTISGVYVKSDGTYTGFFTTIQSDATVKNLNLVNSYIEGTNTSGRCGTGSIAGRNSGTIDTVYSSAIVKNGALMTGGIAGMTTTNDENLISNCWFDGKIYANGNTGGILGGTYKSTATIERCLNTGILNIDAGSSVVGGLCGYAQSTSDVTITDSLNAGSFVQVGEGTVKQVGAILGALHADATLDADHVYGVKEFATKKFGYNGGDATLTSLAVRKLEDIKGYGAYQWTTLDFEDTDADKVYWVLKDEAVPVLNVHGAEDLKIADAKGLEDYTWYDADETEYVIKTPEQLRAFNVLCGDTDYSNFSGKTVQLGADIALNEVTDDEFEGWKAETPTNIYAWSPENFKGTFDGNGKTLSGIYVKGGEKDALVGLFSRVYAAGIVQNLNLEKCYFEGTYTGTDAKRGVGSIAGRSNGLIQNVHSSAVVKSGIINTGGIVGLITEYSASTPNKIANCWFDGRLYGVARTGGILGCTYGTSSSVTTATIAHCLNTGTVNIEKGIGDVGGLCGFAYSYSELILQDSLNAGTLLQTGNGTESGKLGTLVGSVHATGASFVSNNSYGVKEFAEKKFGYGAGTLDITSSAVVKLDDIKGYGAYQWMKLDYEDEDGSEGEDIAYWVLRDGEIPALDIFADSNLSLADAKKLEDNTWFDYDTRITEYVLTTKEQMKLFNTLCNEEDMDYFAGKTVKLGASIALNTLEENEKASDWRNSENAPEYQWIPVEFKGIFDGQGNTLSGVYAVTDNHTGLFQVLHSGAIVRNLKLTDSYFGCTKAYSTASGAVNRTGVGSIAGQNHGTIDAVYSSAIVESGRLMTGGIAGMSADSGENLIANCWFDGQVYAIGSTGGILGGAYKAEATIEHCLNTGDIYIQSNEDIQYTAIGGLFGYAQSTAEVNLADSLNVGTYTKEGNGTVKQVGTVIGAVHNDAKLEMSDVYGANGFSSSIIGWPTNEVDRITRISSAVRTLEQLKGTAAYQWTTLDFEDDTEAEGETAVNDKYWVLVSGDYPALKAFNNTNDSTLLNAAKALINYGWYAEDASEYVIDTAQQLYGFNEYCNEDNDYFAEKTIKLDADITLNTLSENETIADWRTSAPANKWTPIDFKGTFDGQGHTLSGVYVNTTADSSIVSIGLFGTVQSGATVKNLNIVDSYFIGKGRNNRSSVGSVAGNNNGTIDTIYSNAIVENSKQMTGGIVGKVEGSGNAAVTNCWFNGTIYSTSSAVGGILGGTYGTSAQSTITASVEHCLNTGVVNITKGQGDVGGLCGYINKCSALILNDCLNAGSLTQTGSNNASAKIGTIIGSLHEDGAMTVSNAYGIYEFNNSNSCGGNWVKGEFEQITDTDYEVVTLINCVERTTEKLSFYASADDLTNTDPRTCWWVSRDNKIPMLADFRELANTLGK